MDIVSEATTKYLRNMIFTEDEKLREMEIYVEENNIPIIKPEVVKLIELLISMKKPKQILEIGTAIGYSSIIMKKVYNDAKITTIEKDENMYDIAINNIKNFRYEKDIDVLLGDANEILPTIKTKYDFVFIDAAKGQYLNYFKKLKYILNVNAIIFTDNVLFKGYVAEKEIIDRKYKTIVKNLREYLDYIINLENYRTSIIPINDGCSITYKEE